MPKGAINKKLWIPTQAIHESGYCRWQLPILITALSGLDLVLVQYFLVREATAQLFVNEGISLLVVASFFLSFSVGYWWGPRWGRKGTGFGGFILLLVHCAFPWGIRLITGWSLAVDIAWFNLLLVPGLLIFGGTVFHGALLIVIAAETDRHGCTIRKLYAADLVGALVGVIVALVLLEKGLVIIWFMHLLIMTVLIGFVRSGLYTGIVGCAFAVLYLNFGNAANIQALEYFHQYTSPHSTPCQLLYSKFSPYNRVDVFEEGRTKEPARFLYLDGMLYFGTDSLDNFNQSLVGLPSNLFKDGDALVIGSGSMSSVAILSKRMKSITTCEIDPKVVEAGQDYFKANNRLDDPEVSKKWNLVIDDGRHFLRVTERMFDLIAFDVPAPATVKLALLASPQVLRLANQHLKPGGIVAVCASGTLEGSDYSHSVLASLKAVFSDIVYTEENKDGALGFCFGGDDLSDFRRFLEKKPKDEILFWSGKKWLADQTEGYEPISLSNLAAVRELTSYRMNFYSIFDE